MSLTTTDPWLITEKFDYEPLDGDSALLRLLGGLKARSEVEAPTLVVWCGTLDTCYRGRAETVSEPRRLVRRQAAYRPALWRVTFEVPLEIVEYPDSLFTLTADGRAAIALPVPRLSARAHFEGAREPRIAWRVRRHAVAVAAGLAVAAAVSAGGIANATTVASTALAAVSTEITSASSPTDTGATSTGTDITTSTSDTTPTITTTTATTTMSSTTDTTPTTTTATTTTSSTTDTTPATTGTTPATTPPPAATTPPPAATTAPSKPSATAPPSPTHGPQPTTTSSAPAPTVTPTAPARGHPVDTKPARGHPVDANPAGSRHPRGEAGSHHRHHRSGGRPRPAARGLTAPPPDKTGATGTAPGTSPLFSFGSDPVATDPFTAAQIAHFESLGSSLDQPPAFLIPIYKAAGHRYHVPWQILAAINAIETDYGRNLNVSVAGAIGWMQFEPSTWFQYGIHVDGSGQPNPYDPRDAIFSAARYLAANGAPEHMRRAIFAYNHALWYVDAVLWRAQLVADRSLRAFGRGSGYALPLDARYMATLGRTDDGVDIETAPDGAAVYSITPGIVTAVATDPSGFGPDYPVVLVTAGPLAGQYIYYGHVAASLVHVGDHLLAGQPIAIMGHTGDAASLGHGHIEIGFSDSSGDPLNHHAGAGAWTPAGDAMRHVLGALAARFRVPGR